MNAWWRIHLLKQHPLKIDCACIFIWACVLVRLLLLSIHTTVGFHIHLYFYSLHTMTVVGNVVTMIQLPFFNNVIQRRVIMSVGVMMIQFSFNNVIRISVIDMSIGYWFRWGCIYRFGWRLIKILAASTIFCQSLQQKNTALAAIIETPPCTSWGK